MTANRRLDRSGTTVEVAARPAELAVGEDVVAPDAAAPDVAPDDPEARSPVDEAGEGGEAR